MKSQRTDKECRRLHALVRELKSFDKFTEKIQLAMCKAFTHQRWDCREHHAVISILNLHFSSIGTLRVILRKGHVGQNFYFIYSGSVFINVDDTNVQGEKFVKTEVVLTKGDSFGVRPHSLTSNTSKQFFTTISLGTSSPPERPEDSIRHMSRACWASCRWQRCLC